MADALAGAVYHCEKAATTYVAESMAPTTNPPKGVLERSSRVEILERVERGEQITEEEFDRI